ncbi:RHS repeat domain-containing protein, partial [Cesiribacter andamanensis]|uniref:hypothetical protein n=1 Tax=Cesiribacter andamanensis TaxID=649507 RepID=UPI000590912B
PTGGCQQVNDIKVTGVGHIRVVALRTGEILYEGSAENFTSTSACASIEASHPFTVSYTVYKGSSYTQAATEINQAHPISYQFYLQKGKSVQLSSSAVSLKDMLSEQVLTVSGGSFTAPKTGWYLAIPAAGHTQGFIEYSWGFSELSFNFYDDRGRLLASIAPNGVDEILKAIKLQGLDEYLAGIQNDKTKLPFTTHYEYNFRGDLLSVSEPDAGKTEYIYRRDGKIRFSQNAEQRLRGTYSYTNYDALGRPVESGVYNPSGTTLQFSRSNAALKAILESTAPDGGLTNLHAATASPRSQWLTSFYDLPDATEPGFNQQWLSGAVSYTENENSKSWYSYDAEGRVSWMRQRLKAAGKDISLHYSYDFAGKVLEIAYQKDDPAEAFYHSYRYDANQRLKEVWVGKAPEYLMVAATYHYYLHGPLKRVELADNMQGLDYVYTLQGSLKAINHPEQELDPGKDTDDAFAMTLEYYKDDYTRSGTGINYLRRSAEDEGKHTGNITSMSWRTNHPQTLPTPVEQAGETLAYTYTYDEKQQL